MLNSSSKTFAPYIPPEKSIRELTFRGIALGAILGIVFGAASVYLGLRVGLTTSASIPIAVMAITILKKMRGNTVLENNIVQTVGSAGESIAAAVVFTVPALIFLGFPLRMSVTLLIALTGGVLGVLMMIPLRRYLIVKEHGNLRFPEGTACAEILKAGEVGGTSAKKIFQGIGLGALWKGLPTLFGFWKPSVGRDFAFYPGSSVSLDVAPELMGVGYIIGYQTSLIMVGGGLMAAFIISPIIAFIGQHATAPIYPGTVPISEMSTVDIWRNYIKYMGAGAVATGGIVGLFKAGPAIWDSLRASIKQLAGERSGGEKESVLRTERDTPITVVGIGVLALIIFIWLVPTFRVNILGAVLIVVFGFLFSVVSARITGIVGSSSSPLSGMTIAVLMGTCLIFLAVGWTGQSYTYLALVIGAVVCIAISNAGTTAQDLKTGHLLGATPSAQQFGLLIGVVTSAAVVGITMLLLNESQTKETILEKPFSPPSISVGRAEEIQSKNDGKMYLLVKVQDLQGVEPGNYLVDPQTKQAVYRRVDGIGSRELAAPQSNLMAVLISGLLEQRLPWGLIMIGACLAIFMEMIGLHSLTFAVGFYLPLSSTLPIYVGGLVRKIADKRYKREPDNAEESEGTLLSSGLIAGGALLGVAGAFLNFIPNFIDDATGLPLNIAVGYNYLRFLWDADIIAVVLFGVLGYLLYRGAASQKV